MKTYNQPTKVTQEAIFTAFARKEDRMAKQAQNRKDHVLSAGIDKDDGMATFIVDFEV